MEQNMQVTAAKKVWHIVRVAFFMLKRGICKKKMLLELNMMMKRGKFARKALGNFMFHHTTNSKTNTTFHGTVGPDPTQIDHFVPRPGDYEFSCKSTPLYRQYFNKRKNYHHQNNMPSYLSSGYDDIIDNNVNLESVNKVLEMMIYNSDEITGRSPLVRKLRITDSPLPFQEDSHVDEAAEEFIKRFYSQLRQQY